LRQIRTRTATLHLASGSKSIVQAANDQSKARYCKLEAANWPGQVFQARSAPYPSDWTRQMPKRVGCE